MRSGFMIIFAFVTCAFASVSCGKSPTETTGDAPADWTTIPVVGVFALRTIDGDTLPYAFDPMPGFAVRKVVENGSLELDGVYGWSTTHNYENGSVEYSGSYSRLNESTIQLTWPCATISVHGCSDVTTVVSLVGDSLSGDCGLELGSRTCMYVR